LVKLSLSSEQQRQIAIGIGGLVGLILGVTFVVIPQVGLRSERSPKVVALKKQLTQSHERLERMPQLERELADLKAKMELTQPTLSPEGQLPDLLERIAQAARGSQVRLSAVKPKADLGGLTPGPSGFLELPVEVSASAGYHPLGAFLEALERSEMLIRVQELEIKDDLRDLWNHQATLVLQAYLLPGGKEEN
jgi:Tfp pilus assembly protein PilO